MNTGAIVQTVVFLIIAFLLRHEPFGCGYFIGGAAIRFLDWFHGGKSVDRRQQP